MTAGQWSQLNREPKLRRLHPATLRAAWWAWWALRRARRDLAASGLDARVGPPPRLPWSSRTGVDGVLARTDPTCLERAVVMQSWLLAHGHAYDVVVGVRAGEQRDVKAHAWIDGIARPHEYDPYTEIHRIPPRDR